MRVIGLDISRGKVACCLLDKDPLGSDYIDLFHSLDIHEIPADARGINFLLELQPDAIALEPTGVHYAKLWANVASERGIPIYWIGHKQIARFREELGFEDKNDEQDAFAIAVYYWRYRNEPRRFVRERHPLAAELRALGLRLQHLNRCRSPHINYLRQLLSWQFPEAAQAGLQGDDGRPTALLNFIADGEGSPKWAIAYGKTCGAGIDDRARFAARQIEALAPEEIRVMGELLERLSAPTERSSGKKFSKTNKSGSLACRQAILQTLSRYELQNRPLKMTDPDAVALRDRLLELKNSGVPTFLARGRVAGELARKLFYRLVQELNLNEKR